ncbi:hypothetical protein Taro_031723 [Colocasia esculenta]|uniref:Uncharacterized protein n=1 Tax=Colocasia esculenta TaxID=4460 RepID=A0A843VPL9_COLES|nr:hypothetical protein [Colocasia esculenta]
MITASEAAAFSAEQGSRAVPPGTLPKHKIHSQGGRGSCTTYFKSYKSTKPPTIPQKHGSTLEGNLTQLELGVLTLPSPKPRGNDSPEGRGSCLGREGWTSLPPYEERTRWGLLVGLAVSSSHRTA